MATVLNGIVGNTLDNAFAVRAIRESEEHFRRERTMRYLVALGLGAIGAVTFNLNYVIGFGLMVAGGEMALNVVKSRSARDGHPDKVFRIDTARQLASAGIAAAYLYTSAHPMLTHASLLYCTPYVPVLLIGARLVIGYRPALPGSPRLIAALSGEMLGTTLYLGGDVLLLGPGVVAVGVGERTTPAGAEALARSLFDDDLAHTVLAVPIAQERAQMHLDTVCTMVDVDAVVMYPNIVDTLAAYTIVRTGDGLRIGQARPFVEAAAEAMGIEKLRVIDTGLDAVTAEREQWDDGNNTLALAPGVVVGYERNSQTNARLADAGIEVLPIEASELGTGRGGPRCMSCPISRDPV